MVALHRAVHLARRSPGNRVLLRAPNNPMLAACWFAVIKAGGIAVGTMPAKLMAMLLEQRVSDWAEASGSRAAGQFGFRRQRSTAQAALVLRAMQDQHRAGGKRRCWQQRSAANSWTCPGGGAAAAWCHRIRSGKPASAIFFHATL